MDLRQLTTFRMVATTESFTRAALALNYVQSSVTAQIQALEEDLGVQLFDRLGKKIALTDAGQRLLRYADQMLNLAEEARCAVSGGGAAVGTLTISATDSLCTYRLPPILQRFRVRYPDVRLIYRPTPWNELRPAAAEGELDIAFVIDEPIQSTGLVVEPLVLEPLLLVACPQHPLAGAATVGPADLSGEGVLLTEAGCSWRNKFERALARAGVHPATTLEFSSIESIKQCVMAGMGIAVLPEVTIRAEVAEGRLAVLSWTEPDFFVTTQLIRHKDKWLSPAMAAFLEVTREVMGSQFSGDTGNAPAYDGSTATTAVAG